MLLQFVRMRFGVALKNGSCGCQRNEEARKYGGMPRGAICFGLCRATRFKVVDVM